MKRIFRIAAAVAPLAIITFGSTFADTAGNDYAFVEYLYELAK